MLEKTVACLESGSVRRIWPSYRKHLQCQPNCQPRPYSKTHKTSDTRNGLLSFSTENSNHYYSTLNFEFLYPSDLLGLAQKFAIFNDTNLDKRMKKYWLRRVNHRRYSSLSIQKASVNTRDHKNSTVPPTTSLGALLLRIGLPPTAKAPDAWKLFKNFSKDYQIRFRKLFVRYLRYSNSKTGVSSIMIELFEKLDPLEQDEYITEFAVESYLKLGYLQTAIQVYESAVQRLNFPAGCNEILDYQLSHHMWPEAYKFWKSEKSLYLDSDFFGSLGLKRNEVRIAQALVDWINQSNNHSETLSSELKIFSFIVIKKALKNPKLSTESDYINLLGSISNWGPFVKEIYSDAIISLANLDYNNLLLKCYKFLRVKENFYLNKSALTSVLSVSCDKHDMLSMKQVLDDFFSLHSKPSRAAYRMCLKEFSRQGDAKTVYALFKQYISRYKNNNFITIQKARYKAKLQSKLHTSDESSYDEEIDEAAPLTPNDFGPILHVHARRGEIEELESIFDQMKNNYLIEPDILCWNIRLNAYVKIRDVDRAYQCFEEILHHPHVKLDHYTLGTMMAICAYRADILRARSICNLAKDMNIPISIAMINCIIICLVRNNRFVEAEAICTSPDTMNLEGSKTQLWNSLLVGYALNRDLPNAKRIYESMSYYGIEYDRDTCSAFMQALAMIRQPNLAAKILFEVMPKYEIQPTSFHFGVLLGGYLSIKDWENFNNLYEKFLNFKLRRNASIKFLALRAATIQDTELLEIGSNSQRFSRTFQIFRETIGYLDPQDIAETARKGFSQMPIDIMYPALFYSFISYVISQHGEFKTASELLQNYRSWLPSNRKKAGEVMKILTATMSTKHIEHDGDGVKEYWESAVSLAKEESKPLPSIPGAKPLNETPGSKIPYFHQLILNDPFEIYMKSLVAQKNIRELNNTVQNMLVSGFELNNHNWNQYVKHLVRNPVYFKLAFQVCELKLMPGWQGWRIQRMKLEGGRSRIPLSIRRTKRDQRAIRPLFDTMLWLARRMIDLQAKATENVEVKKLINILRHEYPNTVAAIDMVPRTNSAGESILKLSDTLFEL